MRWPSTSWPRPLPSKRCRPGAAAAALAVLFALVLAGCSSTPDREADPDRPLGDAAYDAYPDPDDIPQDLALIPDAVPTDEPPSRYGNPPEYEVFGQRYRTLRTSTGFEEEGLASWYGTKFHGRRTSSGEPYDMYAMTAAHKTLPLPTYVEVVNLENDRRVIVRVNDRGPFVDERIIDLSYAAAHRLDMTDAGVAPVRIRAVGPEDVDSPRVAESRPPVPEPIELAEASQGGGSSPVAASSDDARSSTEANAPAAAANNGRWVQIGAFSERRTAEEIQRDLEALGFESVAISTLERDEQADLHRVRIGPLEEAELQEATERLQEAAHVDYRIVDD
ncbi:MULTISPECIES: septal ring lytic transglycosylase RlpA family protein [unclassified Thioalkalivibrio]|uniref:septal ring lytic transglycosylase RlpA family protein n=1 Tax=unclassified Thioalkalivibrio TaxID=2621013 RepID=UPI0018C8FD5F|nr:MULTISPECIES: septal ring lytic transglycosylase RlpA family protein [unclassified Thioalkalivibrio]